MKITPEMAGRLAQIDARQNKASGLTWRAIPIEDEPDRCDGIMAGQHYIVETDSGVYGPNWNDAQFIAHARQDIPFLLDLIQRSIVPE